MVKAIRRKTRNVLSGILYDAMRNELEEGRNHICHMMNFIRTKEDLGINGVANEYINNMSIKQLSLRESKAEMHDMVIANLYEKHVEYRIRGVEPLATGDLKYPIQDPKILLRIIPPNKDFVPEEGKNGIKIIMYIFGMVDSHILFSYTKEKKITAMELLNYLKHTLRFILGQNLNTLSGYIGGNVVYKIGGTPEGGICDQSNKMLDKYLTDTAYKHFIRNGMLKLEFNTDMLILENDIGTCKPTFEIEEVESYLGDDVAKVYDYEKEEYHKNVFELDPSKMMSDVFATFEESKRTNKKFA